MKTLSCLIFLFLAAVVCAEDAPRVLPSDGPALPPGMARANNPQEVAALHSEDNQQRVAALKSEPVRKLTAQEEYNLKLIAYREQLVEEQRQRKLKELELKLAREERRRAEEEAFKAEQEKQRELSVQHHQALHLYHRYLRRGDCGDTVLHDPCRRSRWLSRCGAAALIQVNID